MRFADLIAPVPVDAFMAEVYGRKPLHIPAQGGDGRASLLGWKRLEALLGILPHWTAANLKLIMNSRPVAAEHYMQAEPAPGATPRANPALVETFLAMGASMVGNSIEEIAPEIKAVTTALAGQFAGRAGANLYASFQGIQAFASHCDLHEVFAIQCEGEKSWRIYANRADHPVEALSGEGAQATIDAVKGPVLMDVLMKPGDLLYIPRGFYHDALASSAASLHLTFGVAPHSGRILFRLLEAMAIRDPAFRRYLPDGREDEGRPLRERLAELAERVSHMMRSAAFADTVLDAQRSLADPAFAFDLPERKPLDFYAPTGRRAQVVREPSGAVLRAGGAEVPLGALADAAEWILEAPAFSTQQLIARFRHVPETELRGLVERLVGLGLFAAYKPGL